MKITQNTVVSFHYRMANAQGEPISDSEGGAPVSYLHGDRWQNILPGLKAALEGRQAGEAFEVTLPAAQAFGERHAELIQTVSRAAFVGIEDIQVGMLFLGSNDEGTINVTVAKVDGDAITVDGNHPLAGQDLQVQVTVVSVREATKEERQTGDVVRASEEA